MARLEAGEESNLYWCPRCGSWKRETSTDGTSSDFGVPKLVERCRQLSPLITEMSAAKLTMPEAEAVAQCRTAFGIAESINTPDNK